MPKAQTQLTSVVTTEESPSYKRQRMREVRQLVAKAVKNNQRVDLMGFEGTDIARSQIALQDLLSKEQEKHARARSHIMGLKDDCEMLAFTCELMMTFDAVMLSQMSDKNKMLSQNLAHANDECHRLAVGWNETMTQNVQLQNDNNGLKTALKATLNG